MPIYNLPPDKHVFSFAHHHHCFVFLYNDYSIHLYFLLLL
uniref:Uncharacterized protein n=1 Tax=Siphoviridae sp. ctWhx86 TaxID=2826362 RepID=A0A8S5QNM1_9CAUD|nr:MAG TPA: hypothetical protein [Siphoviridae sp. ctWhx86]